jgi:molybdate transport system substrate-binding protein
LLTDHVLVGYNRLSFEVLKGNPKNLTDDLNQLTNPQLSVVLSSPESGSVGKNAKKLLDSVGITEAVYQNVTYFTTDSHRIYTAIKNGDADVALNWYATTQWPDHKPYVDAILLPETLSKPKRLELNLLSFSKHPDLAKAFMAYASSEHGLQVFADYGFFTPSELQMQLSKLREMQSKQPKL